MIYFSLYVVAAILGVGAMITAIAKARIEAAHPPTGRFVVVTGGRLHVIDLPSAVDEDAPPVVLIHGASGNAEDMRLSLGDRLARHRRVIIVDRPGHGWSDRPDGADDASPARQAALIAEALDRIGMTQFVLLGHSLGGAVATAFALAYPDRLVGLVLLAPVTHPWMGNLSWYNNVLSMPVVGPLFAGTIAVPIGELLLEGGGASVFSPQPMPASYLRDAAIRLLLRPSQFIANAQDVAALKRFVAGQVPFYRNIKTKTAIITGAADRIVSPDIHARAIAAMLPNARLVILDGIGHMPQHVATDEVVTAIDELSARLPVAVDAGR